MKQLLLTFLLMTSAFAQIEYDEKKIVLNENVSLYSLECVTRFGSDVPVEERSRTQLSRHYFSSKFNAEILMDHDEFYTAGCDYPAMDKLVKDSFMMFNHARIELTIVKRTAKDPRFVFGKCQRNYQEQLKLKFENGIVLKTSGLGMLLPATGC